MSTPPSAADDAPLVARARAFEATAHEQLMRRHNVAVYRTIRGVLKNEHDVEEVMQDTYLHAFEHLTQLARAESFGPWVRRIAFHLALARARRARLNPVSIAPAENLDVPARTATPVAELTRSELRAALERAVDALPDDFRAVFMLRAVDGCSVAETAEALGVHTETVKTRLFRARAQLKNDLQEWAELDLGQAFAFEAPRCDRVVASVLRVLATTHATD